MKISDPNARIDDEKAAKADGLDKATAPPAATAKPAGETKKLTPLRRAMGLERLRTPGASERQVIKRAGGSDWTARCPKRNELDSFQFAKQLGREDGISATKAKKIGLDVLAELASDKQQPGGTRGAAGKALIDYGVAAADSETEGTTRADLLGYARSIRRLILACMECAFYRPVIAQRVLERLQRQCATEPEIEPEPLPVEGRRFDPGGLHD